MEAASTASAGEAASNEAATFTKSVVYRHTSSSLNSWERSWAA